MFQYTIGYVLRVYLKNQLEDSMKNLAIIIEELGEFDRIPNFFKKSLQKSFHEKKE